MKNIIDRLSNYMKIKGLNPNKITVDAGLSVGLIGKSIKSNKGLHSDTIEKILQTYTDLNPEWFITGNGEMLSEKSQKSKDQEENVSDLINTKNELIRFLKEENQRLKNEIAELRGLDKNQTA